MMMLLLLLLMMMMMTLVMHEDEDAFESKNMNWVMKWDMICCYCC
jgi:hypothetical protein